MFWNEYPVWKSTVLCLDGVGHAFSTRAGGSSRAVHTRTLNVGFFRGDDDLTVKNNIKALCSHAGVSFNAVGSPQMHTTDIRIVTAENGGEGIGLFRTEFLFMDRDHAPTEEEQLEA